MIKARVKENTAGGLRKASSGSDSGKKERFIPTSYTADIIWTNNPITPFNHVGIYTAKGQITESLLEGVQTRLVGRVMREYPFEIYKATKKANGTKRYSKSKRKKVASWALQQVNKDYDFAFANNKENTVSSNEKFNCSELVWKAWKFTINVDLDSNGGKGVYPNNIVDSSRTYLVKENK